jgi:hypothetical protein
MPTVGTYGPRKVQTAAIPGARLTAAETLGSTGALYEEQVAQTAKEVGAAEETSALALSKLGNVTTAIGVNQLEINAREQRIEADKAKRQAHEITQMEAANKLHRAVNDIVNDPDHGVLSLNGKDALGSPEIARAKYDEIAATIAATMTDPEDQVAFAKTQLVTGINLDTTVMRHTAGEIQKWEGQELQATVVNAKNDALHAASDPTIVNDLPLKVAGSLQRATDAIQKSGPRLGLGPEQIKEQVTAVTSETHTGVINELLASNQITAAHEYFAETKDDIQEGPGKNALVKSLNEGDVRMKSQKIADDIIAAGGTPAEQRAKARDIPREQDPTGEVRDAVQTRLEHQHALDEKDKADNLNAMLTDAWNIVENTGDINKVPPSMLTALGEHRESLRTAALRIAKGEPRVTEPETYYSLMTQARDNPAAFVKQPLLTFKEKLDDGDFKQLAGLQLSIANGNRNASEKELSGFRTSDQIFNDTMYQYTGTEPKDYTDAQRSKAAQLHRMMDVQVAAAQADGKKITNQEIQSGLDTLLSTTVRTEKRGWFWNSQEDVPLLDVTVNDISASDRGDLERALRAKGRPVSDQTVLDLYLSIKGRKP